MLEYRGQLDHAIVKKPFNYEQEVKRKCNLEKLFMRTKEQHEKEKYMIAELKKLETTIKKQEKEEKNLRKLICHDATWGMPPVNVRSSTAAGGGDVSFSMAVADASNQAAGSGPAGAALASAGAGLAGLSAVDFGGDDNPSNKGGRRDRGSGVYLRSQMLQTQLPTKKEHIQRKFEVVLKELKINPAELRPTERIVGMYH